MTVGIAAVCDDGNAIVAAADRMRTNIMETEPKSSKIEEYGSHCVVLPTGRGNRVEPVINIAREKYSRRDVKKIAGEIRNAYQDERNRKICEEILFPVGLSFEVINGRQQSLTQPVIGSMYQKMAEFNLELSLLIAGIDKSSDAPAKIYILNNPGSLDALNRMDCMAIGSGQHFAYASLAEKRYERDASVNEAVFRVLEAKKISECAPGVGKATDVRIIDEKGIRKIDQGAIEDLEKLIENKRTNVARIDVELLKDVKEMSF